MRAADPLLCPMLNGAQVRRALFRSLPPSFHVPSLLFSSPVGGGRGGLLRFSAPKMDRSIYRRMASLPPFKTKGVTCAGSDSGKEGWDGHLISLPGSEKGAKPRHSPALELWDCIVRSEGIFTCGESMCASHEGCGFGPLDMLWMNLE